MRWHLSPRLVARVLCLATSTRRYATVLAPFVMLFLCATRAEAQHPIFDARGFDQNRPYFSRLPFEHVDPMTGNLLLTFTDLVLPGNAGFDFAIRRTYNSKIYLDYNGSGETIRDDSWAGIGWTLHFGRVLHGGNPADATSPIIEMPDGSAHQAYPYNGTPPAGCSPCYITKEYWIYDKDDYRLTLPNGTTYVFGHTGPPVSASGIPSYYATRIQDTFGNSLTINYMSGTSAPADGIASVVQDLGAQSRTVTFTTIGSTDKALASMSYENRTWNYAQVGASDVGKTLLASVTPPVGPAWVYSYNTSSYPRYELTHVLTPNGGTVDYQYADQVFHLGSSFPTTTRSLIRRTTGGREIAPGTWTYAYEQGSGQDQTVITGPSASTRYTFLGIGTYTFQGASWRVGLTSFVVTSTASGTLQSEQLSWIPSQAISTAQVIIGFNVDNGVFVPLVSNRSVTRSAVSFSTTNEYNTANFNDYGRPYRVSETGQLSRVTTRAFDYGFSGGIIDKIASETVTVGGQSFTRTYSYNYSNGFLASENAYGVATSYGEGSRGLTASVTNARGFQSTFTYSWGTVEDTQTPQYTISRNINSDGSIASETRGGQTTAFVYDDLGRVTRVTPPVGNPIVTTHDNVSGTSLQVSRGSAQTTVTLDGVGRVVATQDAVGVKTDVQFDPEGRRIYESYPFTGTSTGTTLQYDGLGRITRRTHPDGANQVFGYNGINVTITDENGHLTSQVWKAFGDPDEARLSEVTDPQGHMVSYQYSALGNLLSVVQPGTSNRTWIYNSKNQLITESHPESGSVSYDRDAIGNMARRTDAKGQVTTFTYDGNNRVTTIDYPGAIDDVTITYDAWDHHSEVRNGTVVTTFTWEAGRRLTQWVDAFGAQTLTSLFTYDSNDNLTSVQYPSSRLVTYTTDAEGRITSASDGGVTYAGSIGYHPSGAVSAYTAGNGLVHTITRDVRQRVWDLNAGNVLHLTYGYDPTGNVYAITESSRTGMDRTFFYDALDRLTEATGWGGASFSYDSRGNRTSKTVAGRTTAYAYEFTNRLAYASGDEANQFGYDHNGNVASDRDFLYVYKPTDMLSTATIAGRVTTYGYDGESLRVFKRESTGIEHYFAHGLNGQLLAEHVKVGNTLRPVREYVYIDDQLVASIETGLAVSVSLVTPADGQIFQNTTSIVFTASPTVPAGLTVSAVQYFQGGTLIGSSQNSSNNYAVTWNNLPSLPGQYTIVARVIASNGTAAASAPIVVTITTTPSDPY